MNMSFDELKDKLTCKLVNAENNKEYLADKPHEIKEDMALSFVAVIEQRDDGRLVLPITNEIMGKMGVDEKQLKDIALANLSEEKSKFMSMRDMLVGMMFPDGIPENDPFVDMMLPPEEGPVKMYVLTNETGVNGAAKILDTNTMDDIAKELGGDFVVIPSSIHETIMLSMSEVYDYKELEAMVNEVNTGVVDPKDKLSDRVYVYDSKEHELVRMDQMQEHKMEKENAKAEKGEEKSVKAKPEKEKGSSLQDRISKKQTEIDKREAVKDHKPKQKNVALG